MKKIYLSYIVCSLLILASVLPVHGQKLESNSLVTGVCYAGNKVNRIYIPPPENFFKKSLTKGGGSVKFYYSGFPAAAITAMEYAASILESVLPPETDVTIFATWAKIAKSGVLANSSITSYATGSYIDALDPYAFYPVALAEKIYGNSLNTDSEGDITLTVNSSISWYLGTNGITPITKYDLVTVVLHEICHGLGFFDTMSAGTTTGTYGSSSVPFIYDKFIENLKGKKLTDTLLFDNPSEALRSELISGKLYFNGPLLMNYTSNKRAKIYAPSTFDSGSSICHLDEDSTLQKNSLMTPYIDLGEAIHDPGNFTMSILGDLGWINTRIIHSTPKSSEEHLAEILLSATIKSDTAYNHEKVGLVFSYDNFLSLDTVYLTSPQSNNYYNAAIPIPSYDTELEYYFFVRDCFNRLYKSPSRIGDPYYRIYIGTDTVKPEISHSPAGFFLETIDTIKFEAQVTDNINIDTVFVEYKVNDYDSPGYIGLIRDAKGGYKNSIDAKILALEGGDFLKYRIFAYDSALVPNMSVAPRNGYFSVPVEKVGRVVNSYASDFSDAVPDFMNYGFEIIRPAGFSNYGLHTKHPYESPEESGDSIGYIAMLRYPVKFDPTGMMISFNEVVLVEPGEEGSVFGSSGFYDYVIVEGSSDFGKSWFKLVDGYDSRFVASWDSAYNSLMDGQNSIFVGKESMLKTHTIFPKASSQISIGDTMLIRFRLFSDPYANGWGWMIENLQISPIVDAIEDIYNYYEKDIIYPNPGRGLIKIRHDQAPSETGKPLHFKIFNSAGICITDSDISGDSDALVDISGCPTGIYFILLYHDEGIRTIKYCLVK
ncbi:MAG: T9SS type A sorting domain-containing protein [Bacteroidales bacterium]|nr:T9SS type A sorting domain-containing protein [Bacteroidales bacterium]